METVIIIGSVSGCVGNRSKGVTIFVALSWK